MVVPPEPAMCRVFQMVLPISTGTFRPMEWPTTPTRALWPAMSNKEAMPVSLPEHSMTTEAPRPLVSFLICSSTSPAVGSTV